MAEAGIKISHLSNVNDPVVSDYTVLVHRGITCKSALSALQSTFNTTVAADHQKVEELTAKVNALSVRTNNISALLTAINNDYLPKSEIYNLSRSIDSYEIKTDASINKISTDLSGISSSLDLLISDPETLRSLTAVIELLVGEDGKASLSNMANAITAISGKTDNLIDEVNNLEPVIEAIKNKLSDELENEMFQNFSNSNNSAIYSNLSNSEYDFFYDKNRFANIANRRIDTYTTAMLTGLVVSDNSVTSFNITTNIPSIDSLEQNYFDEGIWTDIGLLKNVSIVSAEGTAIFEDNSRKEISAFFKTDARNETCDITLSSTSEGNTLQFLGESTFNLDMVPIRAGMLVENYNGPLGFKTTISGNSNVDLYYANNAKIIDGYKTKINIYINGEKNSKKAGNALTADDTDLNLVFCKNIVGGSTIEFILDSQVTNIVDNTISTFNDIDDPQILEHNLIAAIRPIVFDSETKDINIDAISAWSVSDSSGTITKTNFIYKISGGRTGDEYDLKPYKTEEPESGSEWPEIELTIPASETTRIKIDNTNLNLQTRTINGLTLNGVGLSADTLIGLRIEKTNSPSVKWRSRNITVSKVVRED